MYGKHAGRLPICEECLHMGSLPYGHRIRFTKAITLPGKQRHGEQGEEVAVAMDSVTWANIGGSSSSSSIRQPAKHIQKKAAMHNKGTRTIGVQAGLGSRVSGARTIGVQCCLEFHVPWYGPL